MPEKQIGRLVNKKQLEGKYWWFELEFENDFDFKAGQYVSVRVSEKERRSYSIASVPGGKKMGLLLDVSPAGIGSKFFLKLKLGEKIEVLGPLGRFVVKNGSTPDEFHLGRARIGMQSLKRQEPSEEKSLIFVATGSGIAPIKAMVEDLLPNQIHDRVIRLVWGLRFEKDVFWQKEFEELEKKYESFEFCLTLSRPSDDWKGKKGRVTDILRQMDNLADYEAYICGGNEMVDDVSKLLEVKGLDKSKIHFEKYG